MRKGNLVHTETVDGPHAVVDIEIRDFEDGGGRLDVWQMFTWKAHCRFPGPSKPHLSTYRWPLDALIKEIRRQAATWSQ